MRSVVNGVLWVLILVGLGAIAWWFIKGPFISPQQQSVSVSAAAQPTEPDAYAIGSYESTRVRWNPCEGPIAVRINYGPLNETSRTDAKRAVAAALKAVRTASGLEFAYKGATRDPFPTADSDTRRTDDNAIVIAFLPNDQALLRRTEEPLGIKRVMAADDAKGKGKVKPIATPSASDGPSPAASSVSSTPASTALWRVIVGGDIQIDVSSSGKPAADLNRLVLTGLAATLGLDQSPNETSDNVMAAAADEGLTAYGPGDLAGLAAVGATQGCIDAAQ